MTMTAADDDFIPAEPGHKNGRVQLFVDYCRDHPGKWHRYPHPIAVPATARAKYRQRFPEVQWAVDDDGRLGGRWIGPP